MSDRLIIRTLSRTRRRTPISPSIRTLFATTSIRNTIRTCTPFDPTGIVIAATCVAACRCHCSAPSPSLPPKTLLLQLLKRAPLSLVILQHDQLRLQPERQVLRQVKQYVGDIYKSGKWDTYYGKKSEQCETCVRLVCETCV